MKMYSVLCEENTIKENIRIHSIPRNLLYFTSHTCFLHNHFFTSIYLFLFEESYRRITFLFLVHCLSAITYVNKRRQIADIRISCVKSKKLCFSDVLNYKIFFCSITIQNLSIHKQHYRYFFYITYFRVYTMLIFIRCFLKKKNKVKFY